LLGWAWNIIQPGTQALLLFAATRGAVRVPDSGNAIANFGVFFTAFIIGQGLGELVGRGPTLVSERAPWVKGSLFPLELFAPMAVGVSLYRMVPGGLLGVAAIMIGAGVLVGLGALVGFAAGLGLAIIWGTALGLALSAIGVYLRDAVLAAPIITMGLTFVSPLYVDQTTSGLLASVVTLNPLTVPMNLVLFGPQWIADNSVYALIGFVVPFVALWLAAEMFRRSSADFADYL
jgi:ABC-2 type transport system permease protein